MACQIKTYGLRFIVENPKISKAKFFIFLIEKTEDNWKNMKLNLKLTAYKIMA